MQLGSCSLLFRGGWVGCAPCAEAAVTGAHTWFCPAVWYLAAVIGPRSWGLTGFWWEDTANGWLKYKGGKALAEQLCVPSWLVITEPGTSQDCTPLLGLNVGASALLMSCIIIDPGLPQYHLTGEPF